ncbi:hypothetical protein [Actinomycetospora sp. TBRC 11914]|uniref:hypothetical protein n=1 Tax=Actinomycetospora sp. TBRC 11914 TaxID=2729387 RepID=UPI00145C887C|nr:hypothetical protein [Actinomycetospora sp. TBRC 11914]NMO94075.1 hypothetical protein [Actinomycetospora sp. TBRC 11914]
MLDDTAEVLSIARAGRTARLHDVLRSAARAREIAERQAAYAREVRARTREQTARLIDRWPARHGLTGEPAGEAVFGCVLDAAQRLFGGCDTVSLTVVDQLGEQECRYRTADSVGVAELVDAEQFSLGEGPCIDAVEFDMVAGVCADDYAADRESWSWPRHSKSALLHGVRSSLSIGVPWSAMRVGLQSRRWALGAINLYAREPHAFGRPEQYVRGFGCWAGALASGTTSAEVDHAGA